MKEWQRKVTSRPSGRRQDRRENLVIDPRPAFAHPQDGRFKVPVRSRSSWLRAPGTSSIQAITGTAAVAAGRDASQDTASGRPRKTSTRTSVSKTASMAGTPTPFRRFPQRSGECDAVRDVCSVAPQPHQSRGQESPQGPRQVWSLRSQCGHHDFGWPSRHVGRHVHHQAVILGDRRLDRHRLHAGFPSALLNRPGFRGVAQCLPTGGRRPARWPARAGPGSAVGHPPVLGRAITLHDMGKRRRPQGPRRISGTSRRRCAAGSSPGQQPRGRGSALSHGEAPERRPRGDSDAPLPLLQLEHGRLAASRAQTERDP